MKILKDLTGNDDEEEQLQLQLSDDQNHPFYYIFKPVGHCVIIFLLGLFCVYPLFRKLRHWWLEN